MIRKLFVALISAVMVLSFASVAMADTSITVSGSGQALVPADVAIISLGVSARDKDVLKAQAKVNEAIAAIRAALLESGIAEEDINTDFINIYAMYDYRDDEEELSFYNANSTLAIKTEDMEQVGSIIDIAFGAGANTLNGVNFSASDTQDAEAAALRQAVENATAKAQVLADASGLTISGIGAITEGGTYSYDLGAANNFVMKEEAASDAAGGTVVQAAKLTVSTNINITFTVAE